MRQRRPDSLVHRVPRALQLLNSSGRFDAVENIATALDLVRLLQATDGAERSDCVDKELQIDCGLHQGTYSRCISEKVQGPGKTNVAQALLMQWAYPW